MIVKGTARDPELNSHCPLGEVLRKEFLYLMQINLCCQQLPPPYHTQVSTPQIAASSLSGASGQ